MLIKSSDPKAPSRPPWQQAADAAVGALAGSVVETVYNTASAVRHGGRAAEEAFETVRNDPSKGVLEKAALTVAIPVVTVAAPLATAVGSAVAGAVNGARRGADEGWREAVLGAFGDAIRFESAAALPEQALREARARAPGGPPPTLAQEGAGVVGAVAGSAVLAAGVGASTLARAPRMLADGLAAVAANPGLGPVQKVGAAVGVVAAVAALPVVAAAGAAAVGFDQGFREGVSAGPAEALADAVGNLRKYHEQFVPNALSAVEGFGKPLELSDDAKLPKGTRFGVIGAGPSGIAAARRLAAKGYDVTVLEKNPEPGGKVDTVKVDGKEYELGAVVGVPHFGAVKALAREVGVAELPAPPHQVYSTAAGNVPYSPLTASEKLSLPFEGAKFAWKSLTDWSPLRAPGGYDKAPAELNAPFHDLCQKEGLGAVEKAMRPAAVGLGYGWLEDTPGAYMAKYFPVETLVPAGDWNFWEGGYQKVWKRQAALLGDRVKCDTRISGIEREADGVTVHTNRGDMQFDQLVMAAPPAAALSMLDATPEEKDLLGKVKTVDYRVYLCEVKGLPREIGYLYDNMDGQHAGRPICFYPHQAGSDLFTFYVLDDGTHSDEDVEKNIAADVRKMGGSMVSVREKTRWQYFPHVDSQDMGQGYYQNLEGLQGKNHTTYVGELFNMSTVNQSVEYAQTAMERF